jgi:hypothetical protein
MLATIISRAFCLSASSLKKNIKIKVNKAIILPVVLYGCELKVCDPKTEEGAGGWINLHNEEIRNLYTSPNIVKVIKSGKMRWVGHVARMAVIRKR